MATMSGARRPAARSRFWFHLKSGEPFFLAGLWDRWHDEKPDALASYILMTTQPNELAAKVHDRMPVMLHARDVSRWLDPETTEPDQVTDLLGPYPADEMESRPVSKRVSSPDKRGQSSSSWMTRCESFGAEARPSP
jgi:putative SOS response-associated peptidase YedK